MATYYIDPVGGSGGNAGTFASPWASYTSLPALSAGDFVLQKQSTTFSGRLTAGYSGTAGSPITFGVYNSGTGAQIVGLLGAATIRANGDGTAPAITSGSQAYVEFVGLAAENAGAGQSLILLGKSTYDKDGCFARWCIANSAAINGIRVFCMPGPVGGGATDCSVNASTGVGISLEGAANFIGAVADRNTVTNGSTHGIQWGPYAAGQSMQGGSISNNVCTGNASGTGAAFGIRLLGDILSCNVIGNTCTGNDLGIYVGKIAGGTELSVSFVAYNNCSDNTVMGIQATAKGWTLYKNQCNRNGSNLYSKYGRGIEVFGTSGHTATGQILFNTCNGNKNYGGAINNGTEGGGIGLDDYHDSCLVFGNICIGNEGCGIIPNPNGAAGTNIIACNLLVDNFNVDPGRVAAGSWVAAICSQIYTGATEANLKILNNTFVNHGIQTCLQEICENASAANAGVDVSNNVFVGAAIALKVRTGITRLNNAYWKCAINEQSNVSTADLSADTGIVTTDPLLGAGYRPMTGSSLFGKGTYQASVTRDFSNHQRRNPPAIGAFDQATLRTGL